jgi:hypothetical protein
MRIEVPFAAKKLGKHRFTTQKPTLPEAILGFAAEVQTDRVLTMQGDYSYGTSLLVGIEWILSGMYMMLFPVIAGNHRVCGIHIGLGAGGILPVEDKEEYRKDGNCG